MPIPKLTEREKALLEFMNAPPIDWRNTFSSMEDAVDKLLRAVGIKQSTILRFMLNFDRHPIMEGLPAFRYEFSKFLSDCISAKDVAKDVQKELNERIRRCSQVFDFNEGNFRLDLETGKYPDYDLRVLTAPVMAEFFHRHVERLGCCDHCKKFFVAKRKGKNRFCSTGCKHIYWWRKRAEKGYHAKWMKERRDPDSPKYDSKYIR